MYLFIIVITLFIANLSVLKFIAYVFVSLQNTLQEKQLLQFPVWQVLQSNTKAKSTPRFLKFYTKRINVGY